MELFLPEMCIYTLHSLGYSAASDIIAKVEEIVIS